MEINKIEYHEGEYFIWLKNGNLVIWSEEKLIKEFNKGQKKKFD